MGVDERISQLAVGLDGSSCGTLSSCDLLVGGLLCSFSSASLGLGLLVKRFDLRFERSLLLLGCPLALFSRQRAVGLQLGDLLERVLVGQCGVEAGLPKLCRRRGRRADLLGELCRSQCGLREIKFWCHRHSNFSRDP